MDWRCFEPFIHRFPFKDFFNAYTDLVDGYFAVPWEHVAFSSTFPLARSHE